jgi:hypothetical protein
VLENAPHQLKAELDLDAKKELVSHLYNNLGFRSLTLSGGEVLTMGKKPPSDFIELLEHIRSFRSDDAQKNLNIELYTNGTFLDDRVIEHMRGVVDMVAVTIDGVDDTFLSSIGRNFGKYKQYYENIIQKCSMISKAAIKLKFHSVISTKNHLILPNQVGAILDTLESNGGELACWKFYQYMSYDDPLKDTEHSVSSSEYEQFKNKTLELLNGRNAKLHFKDNKEMNASLFNILPYGNAQYMRDNDTWSSSKRTNDLRSYSSISELFAMHDINRERFHKFHEIRL